LSTTHVDSASHNFKYILSISYKMQEGGSALLLLLVT